MSSLVSFIFPMFSVYGCFVGCTETRIIIHKQVYVSFFVCLCILNTIICQSKLLFSFFSSDYFYLFADNLDYNFVFVTPICRLMTFSLVHFWSTIIDIFLISELWMMQLMLPTAMVLCML